MKKAKKLTTTTQNNKLYTVQTNLLRNKLGKNSAKALLYLLDLLINNLKHYPVRIEVGTGRLFVNEGPIKGSSIYEILPFLTKKITPNTLTKTKYLPVGSEEILRVLAKTAASPGLFPDPRIRKLFRYFRHM